MHQRAAAATAAGNAGGEPGLHLHATEHQSWVAVGDGARYRNVNVVVWIALWREEKERIWSWNKRNKTLNCRRIEKGVLNGRGKE